MSESLIPPHGGRLVDRVAKDEEKTSRLDAAASLPRLTLSEVQHADLCCIATGVYSPLTGFAAQADYESVLDRMRLADGTVWSLPITLAVQTEVARRLGAGQAVADLERRLLDVLVRAMNRIARLEADDAPPAALGEQTPRLGGIAP